MSTTGLRPTSRSLKVPHLDEIDRMVLSEVGKNARASSLQITRRLQTLGYSLTDRAVRKRIQRLERIDIIIGYSAILSPAVTSEKTNRVVLLKFKHPYESQMLERLATYVNQSPFCTYSARTNGDIDWIGHFTFESEKQCELENSSFLLTFKELIDNYRSYDSHTIKCMPYSILDAQDQKERQRQVYEILNSLREYDNLNERLQATVEALVKVMKAKFARLWLTDKEGKYLNLKFSAGRYKELHGPFSRIQVGACKIGEIARTNKPQVSNDLVRDPLSNFPDRISSREKVQSFGGYPLTCRDNVVGVLAMFSERYFSPSDFEIFEIFSKKVSKDITNHIEAHEILVAE